MTFTDIETIQPGWKVYDSSGNEVGEVAEVTRAYLRIKQSGLLKGDGYAPRESIENAEDHGVYLKVGKSELSKEAPQATTSA